MRFPRVLLFAVASATAVTVSNVEPRVDIAGQLMDVHDGNILQSEQDGLYYWVGMGYGDCVEEHGTMPPRDCPGIYRPASSESCGFRTDHAVNVYSSPDLVSWTFVADAFPVDGGRAQGIYFRPKVIFHRQRQEWVLWINNLNATDLSTVPLAAYTTAVLTVATAKSIAGPYQVVTPKANLGFQGAGDFTLMVDDASADKEAYVAYDAWANDHRVVVELLTADYRDSRGGGAESAGGTAAVSSGPVSPPKNEAPILFERMGTYYLLYGHTCCFCREGAGSTVLTAQNPLGPYTNGTGAVYDINPPVGVLQGKFHVTIPAQENYIFQVATTSADTATGGTSTTYVYTGDLWTSSPDGLKSHDLQFWQPLIFNDSSTVPTIEPMYWANEIEIDLQAPQ